MVGPRLESTNSGYSVFVGQNAGLNDDLTLNKNSFFGYDAGRSTTSGYSNVAVGHGVLRSNTTGIRNVAIGASAMYSSTDARDNVAIGYNSLRSNISSDYNTAVGSYAMYATTTGSYNVSIGQNSLSSNTTGYSNTASGYYALYKNTTGNLNTGFGAFTSNSTTTGIRNTAIGYAALYRATTSNNNTGVGFQAGYYNLAGANSTFIGASTGTTSNSSYSNSTALGYSARLTASNQARIGNSSVTSIGGYAGWSNVSDGRFKKNVKEDVVGLDFIVALRPVTYNLDMEAIAEFHHTPDSLRLWESEAEKGNIVQTGFVAQEVEKSAKELGYDFSGVDAPQNATDNYGLRYSEFVVPLVKAVQEQQEVIKAQNAEIDLLKTQYLELLNRIADLEK
jgi:hypothetical protein